MSHPPSVMWMFSYDEWLVLFTYFSPLPIPGLLRCGSPYSLWSTRNHVSHRHGSERSITSNPRLPFGYWLSLGSHFCRSRWSDRRRKRIEGRFNAIHKYLSILPLIIPSQSRMSSLLKKVHFYTYARSTFGHFLDSIQMKKEGKPRSLTQKWLFWLN